MHDLFSFFMLYFRLRYTSHSTPTYSKHSAHLWTLHAYNFITDRMLCLCILRRVGRRCKTEKVLPEPTETLTWKKLANPIATHPCLVRETGRNRITEKGKNNKPARELPSQKLQNLSSRDFFIFFFGNSAIFFLLQQTILLFLLLCTTSLAALYYFSFSDDFYVVLFSALCYFTSLAPLSGTIISTLQQTTPAFRWPRDESVQVLPLLFGRICSTARGKKRTGCNATSNNGNKDTQKKLWQTSHRKEIRKKFRKIIVWILQCKNPT